MGLSQLLNSPHRSPRVTQRVWSLFFQTDSTWVCRRTPHRELCCPLCADLKTPGVLPGAVLMFLFLFLFFFFSCFYFPPIWTHADLSTVMDFRLGQGGRGAHWVHLLNHSSFQKRLWIKKKPGGSEFLLFHCVAFPGNSSIKSHTTLFCYQFLLFCSALNERVFVFSINDEFCT